MGQSSDGNGSFFRCFETGWGVPLKQSVATLKVFLEQVYELKAIRAKVPTERWDCFKTV